MKKLFKKILAIGLAASMTLGMAVTSFAEEQTPEAPKSTENVEVWVNGKDVKANDAKGIKADLNKTANVLLADLKATGAAPIVVVEDLEEVTAVSVEGVTKTGTLTYTAKVTPTDISATIEDETKLTAGTTLTYDADKKTWSASTDGLKITGEPKSTSKIVIEGEWIAKDTDAKATALTIKENATPKFGSVVTFKNGTLDGLSESLAKGNKYVISVIDAPVAEKDKEVEANTIEDAFDLTKGKAVKTTVKRATAKFDKKTNTFNVTAGKESGKVEVWIMEFNSKAKEVVACTHFDVTVKDAPKKFSVVMPEIKEEEKVTREEIEKKYTTFVGDTSVDLLVKLPEGVKADATTTYTWSVKTPKNETAFVYHTTEADELTDAEKKLAGDANVVVVVQGEESETVKVGVFFQKLSAPTKGGSYTVTCTNDQSGKKASFKFTVVNNVTKIDLKPVILANAYTAKQSAELVLGKDYTITTDLYDFTATKDTPALAALDTTDKIKAYVTSNVESSFAEGEDGEDTFSPKGFTLTQDEKKDTFKLVDKCKEVSAKLDKTGKLIISAKKGTLPGTQAKLVLVATRKDKRISVYETLITVGVPAATIEAGETVKVTGTKLDIGKTITLDPKTTVATEYKDKTADLYFVTSDKKVATVDEKGVVTAKKAGTVKITVKSGKASLDYEITVEDPAKTTTTTTTAAPAQS